MKTLLAFLFCFAAFGQMTFQGENGQQVNVGSSNPMPIFETPHTPDGIKIITILGHNSDIDAAADEEIWEPGGVITYLSAAETMDIVSGDAKDTDFAVGVLTLGGNADDGDTVTIGTKVYTFETVLTNVDGNIFIGALATDTIDNLIAGITLGAGSGTLYAALMTEHPNVTAAVGAGDTMGATSEIGNNEAATTDDNANMSWATATLINGVGLRTLRIDGLDSNYNEISEIVSLDGTTTVVTTLSYLRIQDLYGLIVGSEQDNAGIITAIATSAATIQEQMAIGDGISHGAHYTVPRGKVAYIIYTIISGVKSTGGATVVNIAGILQEPGQTKHVIFNGNFDTAVTNLFPLEHIVSGAIPNRTDIILMGGTDQNDTNVFARMQIMLLDK